MNNSENIVKKSDSLIELLTAQCADLEKLLSLARRETLAAERGNFEDILNIVSERSAISRRLETFGQQISELREHLGATAAATLTDRIIEVANLTLMQDRETKLLLTAARESAANELTNLERHSRGANAYLREETRGLAYDQSF